MTRPLPPSGRRPRGRPVGWRKPGGQWVQIPARIPPALLARLRAHCEAAGVAVSEFVRWAVERAVRREERRP
jgi:hypothetical protein